MLKSNFKYSVVSEIKGKSVIKLTPEKKPSLIVLPTIFNLMEGSIAPGSKIFATLSSNVEKEKILWFFLHFFAINLLAKWKFYLFNTTDDHLY